MTREEQIEKEAKRVSYNGDEFHSFIQGAEWADKTMIDKACRWLIGEFSQKQDRDGKPNVESRSCVSVEELIQDFKKAMEE